MIGLNRNKRRNFQVLIDSAYCELLKGKEKIFRNRLKICTTIFESVIQIGDIDHLLDMHKVSAIAMLEHAREHVALGPREGALLLVNSVIETHNNN